MEAEVGANYIFSRLSYNNFLIILSALLLELKIIFFCDNMCVLTTILMFLYSSLKPFRCIYELIFSLPNNDYCEDFLDSPFPILIGINSNSYLNI